MAPRILIFSIAMGADYSFELNSIETYAPQFFGHNNLFLGSVYTYKVSMDFAKKASNRHLPSLQKSKLVKQYCFPWY